MTLMKYTGHHLQAALRTTLTTAPERPNHVLGVDFKGWFLTADGQRCNPLTVTDLHSRFILKIDALEEARTS